MKRLAAVVLLVVGTAFAETGFETAEVHVGYRGRKEEVRTVACQKQADGAWRFHMPTRDIPRDAWYVDVFADGATMPKGDGYWVAGDGNYGRLTRDKGFHETYAMRLPIFGGVSAKGAFVAIIKTLRGEYVQQVKAAKGVCRIYPRFKIEKIEFDVYDDIVVDYYPLEGADANYSGMARKYRAYQLAEGGVKPLREKIKSSDALKYSTESIFLRCKFGRSVRKGIDHSTFITNKPPMNVDHTFDDFMDIMRKCKAIGMDKVDMCMVGWQPDGHDGPFPDLFPPDARFGGEAKMREAIALGKSLGYRMSVHVNWHNYYAKSVRYRVEDVAKDKDGQPRVYAKFKGILPAGRVYDCCWEVMNNRYVDDDIDRLLDMGLNGILHMDVTSAEEPMPCHDPRHPNTRAGMIRWQKAIGEKARRRFGGSSSESGFDHFASALDNILYVAWEPRTHPLHRKPNPFCDGMLPIFPIIYNGIIMSQPYYATIDAPCHRSKDEMLSEAFGAFLWIPTPEERVLKVFEWGGRPMFYYSMYTDRDLADIKRMYDAWQPLKHLQLEFIHEHAVLAPGVTVTRYENGEEVVCNASSSQFSYRGETISPKAHRLFSPPGRVGLAAGAQPAPGLLGPARLEVPEPSAEELVDRAKVAPSLMFRAADLPAIRRRLAEDPDAKAWWEGFRKALDANIAKGVKVPPCGAQWYHWYSCRKCGAQLRGESPTRHVCAKCGEVHSGWPYDDAYWFPLQHQCGDLVRDAGVAWAITGERRYADVAKGLLLDYAKVYLSWPRHDNWSKATDRNPDAARAFSQVLDESVWMIDLVRGFDAISGTLTEEERQTIFARVFRPAADIIYKRDDVGRPILGNHQCWHFSAYALAALVMGDVARVRESIDGHSGWKYQLSKGILEDGCWYEGAWGYQFYTMSSLAPYFTALRNLGYEPPAAFKRLFDSPFGQLAPDWFLPAVNDTARVRFAPGALADLYEQAWTWWGDPQHGWWVAQQPRRTMAYALWGRPARKDAAFTPPASRNFGSSGLAVLRSRSPAAKGPLPDNMLAMDYGPHGGWHGHHDKLQLLLWGRGRMWGEDPGCIAYGNPRHWGWYRSTLAHNTLAMDGRNQAPAQGRLVGYAADGNAAVVAADSGEAYPGATVRRATALVDDIVLDFAEVSADSAHEWEWAFHARGEQETSVTNGVAVPTAPPEINVRDRAKVEAAQDMDHWLWVEDVREGAHDGTWHSVWRQGGDALHLFQKSPAGMLRMGTGPAQPPPDKFRLAVNRVKGGRRLAFRTVMTLDGSADVQIGDEIARNGWHGFSATVAGRRFELTVNGENVRLVEKDGKGKVVRDLAAKR